MLCNVLIVLFSFIFNTAITFNVTDFDANCHILHTSGYGYNTFFHLPETSIRKDGSVYLQFSVIAPSNAHILLSSKNAPSDKDLVYEVVLGAGKNTFSTIRKLRSSLRTSVTTVSILNVEELKEFWVHVDKGVIDVGQENSTNPLLHLEDANPLEVNFISFGAWVGVTATWVYDCKNITQPAKKTRNLVGTRKLMRTVLEEYDPFTIPVNIGEELLITTDAEVQYINLDVKKSLLNTNTNFYFMWTDPKISWDPSEFDNITTFNLKYRRIWLPDFFVFNSVKEVKSPPIRSYQSRITVQNNGQIQWSTSADLLTSCSGRDITYWSWDSYTCSVRIGFHPYPTAVNFVVSPKALTTKTKAIGNDWELIDIVTTLNNTVEEEGALSNNSNSFVIEVTLKRYSPPFVYLFLLPVVCAAIISQVSFILPPDCSSRIYLHSVALIIFALYLITIATQYPSQAVNAPYIVALISQGLALVAIQTIITALIMNLAKRKEEYAPSLRLLRLISNKKIRNIFLLPEDSLYNELEENSQHQNNWFMLSIMLDRIVLFISSIIIAASISIVAVKYRTT